MGLHVGGVADGAVLNYGCKRGRCLDTLDGHQFLLESDFTTRSVDTLRVGQVKTVGLVFVSFATLSSIPVASVLYATAAS